MLRDKVALVTGAGRGIGREIALLMAAHGAKIVVNDLGGSEKGEGQDRGPADEVVREIEKQGGEAVANPDTVATWEGGRAMVQQALDRWGKIDIVVNNAGILRDRMFWKMSEEEWDLVLDVHLKGHFCVTRAAINHMKTAGFGRVINFTSTSGLIGNLGQTNYGAAKMAIAGLTRNLALEMQRYGVTVNAISPFAWTRLIGTIPTGTDAQKARVEKIKQMSPAHIAPLVVFLASEAAAEITGQIFGVRAKEIILFSVPRPVRTIGRTEGWTPEDLAEVIPGAFGSSFFPLTVSAQEFPNDPLI